MSKLPVMTLEPHTVHVWHASTLISEQQERALSDLLSADEMQRANRFHFPLHRRRYIAARGMLRQLLEYYRDQPARDFHFEYTRYKKPYLADTELQFNISHSHD